MVTHISYQSNLKYMNNLEASVSHPDAGTAPASMADLLRQIGH
jgi:hypothetical protein